MIFAKCRPAPALGLKIGSQSEMNSAFRLV